jgi:hypothetical protein
MTPDGKSQEASVRKDSARFFRRKEDKYEVGLAAATYLQAEIARRLPRFEYHSGYPYTFITTLYYDTKNRDFYRQAVRHYDDNVKIRVKEYYYSLGGPGSCCGGPKGEGPVGNGPAGATSTGAISRGGANNSNASNSNGTDLYQISPQCYVELKQSLNGTVTKKRFAFPKKDLSLLFNGQDVWPILLKVTPAAEHEALREIYRELKRYISVYPVEVTSIVNYRRTVYQENEDRLRITFDDSLAVFPPVSSLYESNEALTTEVLGKATRRSDKVILEIKCSDEYPEWLKNALQFHSSKRLSKFTTSVRYLLGTPSPFFEDEGGGNSSN